MSAERDKLLNQIQNGKRVWTLEDVPGRNPETFMVLVLAPLCKLLEEGLITAVNEHTVNFHGEMIVERVHITVDRPF